MNKNTLVSILITAVVFGGVGYWYGASKAQSNTPADRFTQRGANGNFGSAGGRGGRNGSNNAFGTIIAKNATSITVQLASVGTTTASAGSKIVLYSGTTQVSKTISGSAVDLSVGESVAVSGTPNSDGSVTANTIQIRPAGAGQYRQFQDTNNNQ